MNTKLVNANLYASGILGVLVVVCSVLIGGCTAATQKTTLNDVKQLSAGERWQQVGICRDNINLSLSRQNSSEIITEVAVLERHLKEMRQFTRRLVRDRQRQVNELLRSAMLVARKVAKAAVKGDFEKANSHFSNLNSSCMRIESALVGHLSKL